VASRNPRYDDAAFLAALDRLIDRLRSRHPELRVERIRPEDNPCGDDWIWYFRHPGSPVVAQVDPDWEALFLVSAHPSADAGVAEVDSEADAAELIARWLGLHHPKATG